MAADTILIRNRHGEFAADPMTVQTFYDQSRSSYPTRHGYARHVAEAAAMPDGTYNDCTRLELAVILASVTRWSREKPSGEWRHASRLSYGPRFLRPVSREHRRQGKR